jgi:hypothetical protein
MQSTHGKVGCVICHSGDSSVGDKELAHVDLVDDPSEISCDTCHKDIACVNQNSLHTTLSGMKYAIEARGGNLDEGSALATAFCHTLCSIQIT